MKKLLTSLFTIIVITVNASNDSTSTFKRVYIGTTLDYGFERPFQLLKYNPYYASVYSNSRNFYYGNDFFPALNRSVKLGASLLLQLKPKRYLYTGLFIKQRTAQTEPLKFGNNLYDDTVHVLKSVFRTIELPIGINYYSSQKKVSVFGSTTIINSFNINHYMLDYTKTVTNFVTSSGTYVKQPYSRGSVFFYNLGISQGFGIEFNKGNFKLRINPIITFYVLPYAKETYNPTYQAQYVKFYNTDFTLSFGVYYSLK
jgi:hypothetical protein